MARALAVAALASVLVLGCGTDRKQESGGLILVSRFDGPTGPPADDDSFRPSLSAHGERVAFESIADNLSPEDDDRVKSVFVREVPSGDLIFASRSSGRGGVVSRRKSLDPVISQDGRFVTFNSKSMELSPDVDRSHVRRNVFVRDLDGARTILVSRANGQRGAAGTGDSVSSSISRDGRYVAFASDAANLSREATRGVMSIYVRDLLLGRTVLVSRGDGPRGPPADGRSIRPAISADGRYVAFISSANNLSHEDDDSVSNLFVRDLRRGRTILAGRGNGVTGRGADGSSVDPAISSSGRYVAFASTADNLSSEDDNSVTNIFVRDLRRGRTMLTSRESGLAGAAARGDSKSPSISGDGRLVAFSSSAQNLGETSGSRFTHVYVRDVRGARTVLADRVPSRKPVAGNGDVGKPSISADGRYVAFPSEADNLSADDDDGVRNVFVRRLSTPLRDQRRRRARASS